MTGEPGPPPPALTPLFRAALPDSAAALAWSPDGGALGAASLGGPVVFLDGETGALLFESAGHAGGALSMAFCPTGAFVATGGEDGEVHVYSLAAGGEGARAPHEGPARWKVGRAPVAHLAWSREGEVLAAASGRSVVFFSASGERLSEVADHVSTVASLSFSAARGAWLSACYGSVSVIGREGLQIERQLLFRTSILAAVASPDGRYVAAGTQDPIVRVWDLEGDDEAIHLEGYPGKVPVIAWSGATQILATASGRAAVLWSFAAGDPRDAPHVALAGHERRVTGAAFTADGRALCTTSLDGALRFFDLNSPDGLSSKASLDAGAPLHLLSAAPDRGSGAVLAAAGTDGSVHACRLEGWSRVEDPSDVEDQSDAEDLRHAEDPE